MFSRIAELAHGDRRLKDVMQRLGQLAQDFWHRGDAQPHTERNAHDKHVAAMQPGFREDFELGTINIYGEPTGPFPAKAGPTKSTPVQSAGPATDCRTGFSREAFDLLSVRFRSSYAKNQADLHAIEPL
jgi:hypothetical protein